MMIGTTFDLLLLVHCAVRFTRLPAILLLDKTYPHTGVFRIAVAYRQINVFWGDVYLRAGLVAMYSRMADHSSALRMMYS